MKRYSLNDKFFDELNPVSGWVLGALVSDGCIGTPTHPTKITISSVDVDFISAIRLALNADHPIKSYKKGKGHLGKKEVFQMTVFSVPIIERLKSLNCYGAKETRNPFPYLTGRAVKWGFIRGLFDGDGTIYRDVARGRLSFQICGSVHLLEDVASFIKQELSTDSISIYEKKGKDIYDLHAYCKGDIKRIYSLMYEAHPEFCNKRKRKKFYVCCRD